MDIPVWKENMSDKEAKDVAYWERNMLALHMAVYANAVWNKFLSEEDGVPYAPCGWYKHEGDGFEGWSRVISLFDGTMTFHVPDSFDLGPLREIEPNWDGHTTEEKWMKAIERLSEFAYGKEGL